MIEPGIQPGDGRDDGHPSDAGLDLGPRSDDPDLGRSCYAELGRIRVGRRPAAEECGVFGIFGHPDVLPSPLGLHALQHRGQEAAGIVSFDGKRFHSERRLGLVGDNFSRREVIERLPGM